MHNARKRLLAGPYLVWIIGFTVLPILMILYYAFTNSDGGFTWANIAAIADPVHIKALLLSLKLGILCTIVCLLLSYPLAMILNSLHIKHQSFVVFIFVLPMWMNFMLRILAWQMLLSNNGIINGFLSIFGIPKLHMLNTQGAVVFGMIYDFLPFMIMPIYVTLVNIDKGLHEAARDLGAGEIRTFFLVTFPLSMPGIVSGVTMVFLPAMTNYVVLDMLYNSTYIMGSLIGSYFSAYDWNNGSMISIVLLAIILIVTFITNKIDDKRTDSREAVL